MNEVPTNCKHCDRASCPVLLLPYTQQQIVRAGLACTAQEIKAARDCAAHEVDWRTRCLAAESEVAQVACAANALRTVNALLRNENASLLRR